MDIIYCLLITFANSLEPDQAREDSDQAGENLDPNCSMVFIFFFIFFKKLNFRKFGIT